MPTFLCEQLLVHTMRAVPCCRYTAEAASVMQFRQVYKLTFHYTLCLQICGFLRSYCNTVSSIAETRHMGLQPSLLTNASKDPSTATSPASNKRKRMSEDLSCRYVQGAPKHGCHPCSHTCVEHLKRHCTFLPHPHMPLLIAQDSTHHL